MYRGERGESLIGVVVGVGVVAVTTAALLSATLTAARHFGPDPIQRALDRAARRELRIAVDLLKYQGASIPARSIATTIPLPSAPPFAAHLSVATAASATGSITVSVAATSDLRTDERAAFSAMIAQPAPLPSSLVPDARAGGAPQ